MHLPKVMPVGTAHPQMTSIGKEEINFEEQTDMLPVGAPIHWQTMITRDLCTARQGLWTTVSDKMPESPNPSGKITLRKRPPGRDNGR